MIPDSFVAKSRDAWKQLALTYIEEYQRREELIAILQGADQENHHRRDLLTERANHWEQRAIEAEKVLRSEQWQWGKDYPRLNADYKRLRDQHESLLVKCQLLYRIIRWLADDRNQGRITFIPDGLQDLYDEVLGPPRD